MTYATVETIIDILKRLPEDYQCNVLFGNLPVTMVDNKMVYLNDTDSRQKALDANYDHLIHTKSISSLFTHFSKPYRLYLLHILTQVCSLTFEPTEYASVLFYSWTSVEFPSQMPTKDLVDLFKQTKRELLMTDFDDCEYFSTLKDPITIYRGLQDEKSKVKSLSWTLDEKIAKWFAHRWGKGGKVYTATVVKEDVFCYTNQRNEQETIVNPYRLKNVVECG